MADRRPRSTRTATVLLDSPGQFSDLRTLLLIGKMEQTCLETRTNYRLAEKIGEGGTSRVWRVCDGQDCSRIMRVTKIDSGVGIDLEGFEDSVTIQKEFAILEVSPKVFDCWICRPAGQFEYGVMIMEDAGRPLWNFADLETEDLTRVLDLVATILDFIHERDWYHGDVSPSNITLKKVDRSDEGFYVDLPDGLYRIYLIDTDSSGQLSLANYALIDENMKYWEMRRRLLDP